MIDNHFTTKRLSQQRRPLLAFVRHIPLDHGCMKKYMSCRQRKKKGVSSSVRQGRDLAEKPKSREELLNMETNETTKREPYQEAEQELLK